AGVMPKPPGLAEGLKSGRMQVSLESMMSMRQKGFFITPDGRLLSKEGELQFETANGLLYALRFGEVVPGQAGAAGNQPQVPGENRYLFVTVSYDAAREAKYGGSGGERAARDLSGRFADWYYVISGSDAGKLRLRRRDLVRG